MLNLKLKKQILAEYVSEEVDLRNRNLISRCEDHGDDLEVVVVEGNY